MYGVGEVPTSEGVGVTSGMNSFGSNQAAAQPQSTLDSWGVVAGGQWTPGAPQHCSRPLAASKASPLLP